MMIETGLRRNECRSITLADVDLDQGTLTTRSILGWKQERQRRGSADCAWVFGDGKKKTVITKRDAAGRVLDLHSLRHTFGTRLNRMPGVDPKSVQTLMRHSDPRMTFGVYVHSDKARLQAEVAQYKCFIAGDWEAGLALLAAANDATLKPIADLDLAKPDNAEAQVAVGDGWFNLSEKEPMKAHQAAMQMRASAWYARAVPSMTGLAKAALEKRLKDMQETHATPVASLVKSSLGTNAGLTKWTPLQASSNVSKGYYMGPFANDHDLQAVLDFLSKPVSGKFSDLTPVELSGSKGGEMRAEPGKKNQCYFWHYIASPQAQEAHFVCKPRHRAKVFLNGQMLGEGSLHGGPLDAKATLAVGPNTLVIQYINPEGPGVWYSFTVEGKGLMKGSRNPEIKAGTK